MQFNQTGEIAALATAVCWTVTALAFESAGRKIGSLQVNIIRLVIGFIFLSITNAFVTGAFFPVDAGLHQWIWLSVSGLFGFVIGDLLLFKSFTIITSRISLTIMTLVPLMTTGFGWLILNEVLSYKEILGMTITIGGIVLTLSKPGNGELKYSMKGILYALGGAIGQASGLVLSKYGMQDYHPFPATQIRVITGIVGFVLIVSFSKRWKNVIEGTKNKQAMKSVITGSFFGPFLGVSLSLVAIQYTQTGVAATLMALTPILIIFPSVVLFKQKVSWQEIAGAFISVGGVSLLFL